MARLRVAGRLAATTAAIVRMHGIAPSASGRDRPPRAADPEISSPGRLRYDGPEAARSTPMNASLMFSASSRNRASLARSASSARCALSDVHDRRERGLLAVPCASTIAMAVEPAIPIVPRQQMAARS